MIDVSDIQAEVATLLTYVALLVPVILGAYGVKFGFRAAWTAVRKALGITASTAKG